MNYIYIYIYYNLFVIGNMFKIRENTHFSVNSALKNVLILILTRLFYNKSKNILELLTQ